MKNILILETEPALNRTFEGFLKSQTGFLNILTSEDPNDALGIIEQIHVHMVIIGFQLPEIEAFNFVSHIEKHHPDIRIIIILDNVSPLFRASFKSFNSAIFFEKVEDIHLLLQRIFAELKIKHGGLIKGISLSSFLQMMEMEKNCCTLQIRTKSLVGCLFVNKGKLISAKFEANTGLNAALEILSWKNVSIEIDYTSPDVDREITMPMIPLMLEALRLADEKQINRPDLRQHERYDCMIAMDYEVKDWNSHGLLWDISLGGAYIETDQAISIGSLLMVTLSSQDKQLRCKVKAKVVRRDRKGVGICFENIGDEQKEIISSLILNRLTALAEDSDLSIHAASEIISGD